MSRIKTITVDEYYSVEEAKRLENIIYNFNFQDFEFGTRLDNFNLVPPDIDELLKSALNMNMKTDMDASGVFRIGRPFIHFESFSSANDWIFCVAIQETVLNIFESKLGPKTALDGYELPYFDLMTWNLIGTHILQPGQGILIRPWVFHSLDTGLVQIFKMVEQETDKGNE